MKYLVIALLSSLLFAACSSSTMVTMDPVRFDACTDQSELTSNATFTGETVDNLVIDQQQGIVFVTMNVRTYCNSQLSMTMEQNDYRITLKLANNYNSTDNCVCIKKARTSLRDLTPGTYNIRITDITGYQLLDQKSITIPEQ